MANSGLVSFKKMVEAVRKEWISGEQGGSGVFLVMSADELEFGEEINAESGVFKGLWLDWIRDFFC